MVQSTGHEVYRSVISPVKLGGWGLAEEDEGDGIVNGDSQYDVLPVLDDRSTAWVVSVPGESKWMALVGRCALTYSKYSDIC